MKLRKAKNLLLYIWYLTVAIVPFVALVFLTGYWIIRIALKIVSLEQYCGTLLYMGSVTEYYVFQKGSVNYDKETH